MNKKKVIAILEEAERQIRNGLTRTGYQLIGKVKLELMGFKNLSTLSKETGINVGRLRKLYARGIFPMSRFNNGHYRLTNEQYETALKNIREYENRRSK